MPTFDFQCPACSTTFEGSIPFGSKKTPACPKCGAKKTNKLLTTPMGIVFKGSGFYKTDSTEKPQADTPAQQEAPKPVEKKEAKE